MNDDRLQIHCGDCLEVLRTLPSESVQLTVTSPPYDQLRRYGGHSWDFEGVAKELYRVTCEGGVVCWNVNDSVIDGSETLTSAKQKIFFREQCGFRIHDTMIYERTGFPAPETIRYNQSFEYVFVLSKEKPRTFNPIVDRVNVSFGAKQMGVSRTMRNVNGESVPEKQRNIIKEVGVRTNVWKGATASQENPCSAIEHPAQMPKWLAHDLILSWSNPGDTVLDPFAGSGTTGREALQLARKVILIEINPDYIPIIERSCDVTPGLPLETTPSVVCPRSVTAPVESEFLFQK